MYPFLVGPEFAAIASSTRRNRFFYLPFSGHSEQDTFSGVFFKS